MLKRKILRPPWYILEGDRIFVEDESLPRGNSYIDGQFRKAIS